MKVQVSSSPGATNVSNITFEVHDDSGNRALGVAPLRLWLSDSSIGAGFSATSPSGTPAAASSAVANNASAAAAATASYSEGRVRTAPPAPGDIKLGSVAFTPGGKAGVGWMASTGTGFSAAQVLPSLGVNAALFTIGGLLPGAKFIVRATWPAVTGDASAVVYSVFDGNALLGTTTVDQTALPAADETVSGKRFKTLGTWTVTSGVVRVLVTDAAGGTVQADAVRVVTGSQGALIGALTTSLVYEAVTDENGTLIVAVTDTGKTAYYLVASVGAGPVTVGPQLTTGSYGA